MERVLGVGGYFVRAADPAALLAWYRDALGLDADENGVWNQEPGVTETQAMDGVGRFGWVTDPEGNRVELWQPS